MYPWINCFASKTSVTLFLLLSHLTKEWPVSDPETFYIGHLWDCHISISDHPKWSKFTLEYMFWGWKIQCNYVQKCVSTMKGFKIQDGQQFWSEYGSRYQINYYTSLKLAQTNNYQLLYVRDIIRVKWAPRGHFQNLVRGKWRKAKNKHFETQSFLS